MMPELPYRKHPAMQLLLAGVRREWHQRLALALLLSGGGLGWWGSLGGGLLPVLMTGGGLLWLGRLLGREHWKRALLWQLLAHEPRRIVWVYGLVIRRLPFGFELGRSGLLYFMLDDGESVSVPLPADKLKLVSRFLNRLLPHATFGWSAEKLARYRRHPPSLRRN